MERKKKREKMLECFKNSQLKFKLKIIVKMNIKNFI